jgi:dinuclear metal center YbgI/SA1388 family protein
MTICPKPIAMQAEPGGLLSLHNSAMTQRDALTLSFNQLLQPERFKDYGPNGLQVEGKAEIKKIVSGVTASLALIEVAIERGADAIFVHHGLFWRGQDGRVTGWMKQRLQKLLAHDINLYAYHLPLDAHPTLGNNAQLGKLLGFLPLAGGEYGRFGEQDLGWLGMTDLPSFASLRDHLNLKLNRYVAGIDTAQNAIKKVAWCTGGAQSYFEAAIAVGADVFITGEMSEPQAHYAREMGVSYMACGHHASERYGSPAVAAHVAAQLGLAHEFVDIDNPA